MLKLLSRKTANDVVIEIQNEIDTAQDRLLQQAKDIIAYRQPLQNKKAERLAAVGFINSTPVITNLENKNILVKTREQANFIEYYKQNYPFQKFITEDELKRICKKYNLIYMPVENYAKDVPEANLIEIENSKQRMPQDAPENLLWCELKKDNSFFLTSRSGGGWCGIWGSEWYRIPKKINGINFFSNFNADTYLKNEFGFTTDYLVKSVKNFSQNRQGLFIAAPKSHFKGVDKSIFSFIPEPKDPIVFRFVKGGIQVLSKWGLEGQDEVFVNEKLN